MNHIYFYLKIEGIHNNLLLIRKVSFIIWYKSHQKNIVLAASKFFQFSWLSFCADKFPLLTFSCQTSLKDKQNVKRQMIFSLKNEIFYFVYDSGQALALTIVYDDNSWTC